MKSRWAARHGPCPRGGIQQLGCIGARRSARDDENLSGIAGVLGQQTPPCQVIAWNPTGDRMPPSPGRVTRGRVVSICQTLSEGGQPVRLTGRRVMEAVESPDGTELFVVKLGPEGRGLWSMTASGGPEVAVLPSILGGRWAVAETGVYLNFTGHEEFAGRATSRVAALPLRRAVIA